MAFITFLACSCFHLLNIYPTTAFSSLIRLFTHFEIVVTTQILQRDVCESFKQFLVLGVSREKPAGST